MDGAPGAETVIISSLSHIHGNVTLPFSSDGELADGGRLYREAHRNQAAFRGQLEILEMK